MIRCSICLAVFLLWSTVSRGEIELPAIFSDHMVVQREKPVTVWGWADPGQTIVCQLAGQSKSTSVGNDGKWSLMLDALPAGGPHKLAVNAGDQTVQLSDVYVGEVWLCSGQSNMAMSVRGVQNSKQEIADAKFPKIRMFKVSSGHATEPQDRCRGIWSVCNPETVSGFSATGYFFARSLHENLDVPIGLINSSVGGTAVESWTSMSAQKASKAVVPVLRQWRNQNKDYDAQAAKQQYEKALANWETKRDAAKASGKRAPRRPTLAVAPAKDKNFPSNLYNGKIHPLVGYTLRGAIWYQGERNSNGTLSHLYGDQLETLIKDWRGRWGQGDFPFAWVQLPNFKNLQTQPSETTGWVQVREGMLKTLHVPNTGMAITVDVGDARDIHPKNKQAVGSRLARWAIAEVYGRATELPEGAESMGPIYQSAKREGKRIRIDFQHVGDELPQPTGELKGFAIAGKDQKFHWAKAEVIANHVEVWSDNVSEPVAVRYSWAANPIGNLYNQAGLPASPFRTDDWDQ